MLRRGTFPRGLRCLLPALARPPSWSPISIRWPSVFNRAEAELAYSNSAIAHELRTPLTILRGRLQGLLDGVFEPNPLLFERLVAHVDSLSAIVEELRTLALNNAGQLELTCIDLDLAIEAGVAADALEAELAGARIKLTRVLGSAVVTADQTRLQAVVRGSAGELLPLCSGQHCPDRDRNRWR